MAFLAHARGESDGTFLPVLVANRLPKSGERHSVHLVSLMYCFNTIISDSKDANFNANQVSLVGTGNDFRLVSLHNWTFYCENTGDFKEQLKSLDNNMFRLPTPSGVSVTVAKYFQDGFALLPHHLRIGRDVASLYRGPLSAGRPGALPFSFPVDSADHLLLYDRQSGMLDVSYAAAWTLGRQLALEDKNFALDIYKYKHQQTIIANRKMAVADVNALAIGKKDYTEDDQAVNIDLKNKILDWLDQYKTLKNIPFHYLVPQENLLPNESIRFFQVDANWLKCLQYGALSLGGNLSSATAIAPNVISSCWAFLLRSRVVTEFPKLRIEGYADRKPSNNLEDRTNPITPEIKKLSDNLLFVSFAQQIQTVDIFLDPVNLYFGFREAGGKEFKDLKKTDGSEISPQIALELAEWRDTNDRVLHVDTFAKKMRSALIAATADSEFDLFTSADFALQMVEGAPRVRFYVANS